MVLSGSMAPALEVGDLAVIAPVAPEALRVGDVVSYHSASLDHPHVTHRLVAITASVLSGGSAWHEGRLAGCHDCAPSVLRRAGPA